MEVIAKTANGYIVDISRNELANLVGYYYAGAKDYTEPKIGDTVAVSDMYNHLRAIAAMPTRLQELKNLANGILECSGLVEPIACAMQPGAK